MPPGKTIVIGAGVAGIAAAIRLAIKGYAVIVFEAGDKPGGKLTEFTKDGFRFDAGPSLFTMPQYVDELFALAGRNPANYFTYNRVPDVCRYFYPDGTRITVPANEAQLAIELAKQTGEPLERIQRHIENSARIYRITNPVFLQKSLHRIGTYLNFTTIGSLLQLPKIDAGRSLHKANQSYFKDKRIVQYFDRYATYNGSNPYRAPATLNVIPHLEQHYGVYFPDGGMYSIVQSLVKLAEELGVKFEYNSPVQEIILEGKQAMAVKVKDEFVPADLVISNMDVWFTYKKLLAGHPQLHPKKTLNQERSSSALIFYWGINKSIDTLGLHNIFFSADYQFEFNAIWNEKTVGPDPTVYVNISSKMNPADAPEGGENWFVMVNAPANAGQDWDALIASIRKNVIKKLSAQLSIDLEKLIVSETVLDPRGIERNTSSYRGSLYGASSNNAMAAFLRHANKSGKIKNLYFCGGSVHPGGGIPLALLSAKITADWVG